MRTALITALLVYINILSLSGCSLSQLPFLYNPALEQGTVLDKEQVARLRSGMTPQQVQFLLGTPTILDPFHANRWDYVYLFDPRNGKPPVRHHLTLFFDESHHLQAAQGDVLPADSALRKTPGERARLSAR